MKYITRRTVLNGNSGGFRKRMIESFKLDDPDAGFSTTQGMGMSGSVRSSNEPDTGLEVPPE